MSNFTKINMLATAHSFKHIQFIPLCVYKCKKCNIIICLFT